MVVLFVVGAGKKMAEGFSADFADCADFGIWGRGVGFVVIGWFCVGFSEFDVVCGVSGEHTLRLCRQSVAPDFRERLGRRLARDFFGAAY